KDDSRRYSGEDAPWLSELTPAIERDQHQHHERAEYPCRRRINLRDAEKGVKYQPAEQHHVAVREIEHARCLIDDDDSQPDQRVNRADQHAANRGLDKTPRLLRGNIGRDPRDKDEDRCGDQEPFDRTPEIEWWRSRWSLSLCNCRHYSISSIRTAVSTRPARPS